jgi:hypothetical protein
VFFVPEIVRHPFGGKSVADIIKDVSYHPLQYFNVPYFMPLHRILASSEDKSRELEPVM